MIFIKVSKKYKKSIITDNVVGENIENNKKHGKSENCEEVAKGESTRHIALSKTGRKSRISVIRCRFYLKPLTDVLKSEFCKKQLKMSNG